MLNQPIVTTVVCVVKVRLLTWQSGACIKSWGIEGTRVLTGRNLRIPARRPARSESQSSGGTTARTAGSVRLGETVRHSEPVVVVAVGTGGHSSFVS